MKIEMDVTVEVKREKKLFQIARQALVPGWTVGQTTCDLCLFEFERDEPVCVIKLDDGRTLRCHDKCVQDRTR